MNIRRCRDCRQYKYLINGKCKSCLYNGIKETGKSNLIHNNFGNAQLAIGRIGGKYKTTTQIGTLREMKDNHGNIEVFVIDPLSEYDFLETEFGGEIKNIGAKFGINPFQIPKSVDTITPRIYNESVDFATEFILSLIGSRDLNRQFTDVVTRAAVRKLYEKFNIEPGTSNPSKQPTLDDYMDIIEKTVKDPDYLKISDVEYSMKMSSRMLRYKKNLTDFMDCEFNTSRLFEPTGSDDNNIRVYRLDRGTHMGVVQQEILKLLYHHSTGTDKNVVVVSSESHMALKLDQRDSLATIFRNTPSSLRVQFCTQSLSDFSDHPQLLDMFDSFRLHNILPSKEKHRKKIGVSQNQANQIKDNTDKMVIGGSGNLQIADIQLLDSELEIV